MIKLLIGILIVAVVATVGDYVWFEIGIRHRATAGALHGAVLLGAVGAVQKRFNSKCSGVRARGFECSFQSQVATRIKTGMCT